MNGAKDFSVTVFGVIGIAFGHYVFGLDWIAAIFLSMPMFGLIAGLFNNEGERNHENPF